MSQRNIIAFAVAAIVVLLLGWYFLSGSNAPTPMTSAPPTTPAPPTTAPTSPPASAPKQ